MDTEKLERNIYIALKRPKLNDQVNHNELAQFRNSIAYSLFHYFLLLFNDLSFVCMDACLKFEEIQNVGFF